MSMKKRSWTIADDIAIAGLHAESKDRSVDLSYTDWIKALRNYLRMTQAELAERAHLPQSHLAQIEAGKIDLQVGTLKRIFEGLSCDLVIQPLPRKPLSEVLRGRARSVASKRLKQTMGTMALENQAPEKELFKRLLEKRTDDVLNDPRERLWNKKDG